MLHQQLSDICDILKWIITIKIAEIQDVVDRYTAFPPHNLETVELVTRETTWRKYAISGLKTVRKDLTPVTLERMLALKEQEQGVVGNGTRDDSDDTKSYINDDRWNGRE